MEGLTSVDTQEHLHCLSINNQGPSSKTGAEYSSAFQKDKTEGLPVSQG